MIGNNSRRSAGQHGGPPTAPSNGRNHPPSNQPPAGHQQQTIQTSIRDHMHLKNPESAFAEQNQPRLVLREHIYQLRKAVDEAKEVENNSKYEVDDALADYRTHVLQAARNDEEVLEHRRREAEREKKTDEFIIWARNTRIFARRNFSSTEREKEQFGIIERYEVEYEKVSAALQTSDVEKAQCESKIIELEEKVDAFKISTDKLESANLILTNEKSDQARNLLEAEAATEAANDQGQNAAKTYRRNIAKLAKERDSFRLGSERATKLAEERDASKLKSDDLAWQVFNLKADAETKATNHARALLHAEAATKAASDLHQKAVEEWTRTIVELTEERDTFKLSSEIATVKLTEEQDASGLRLLSSENAVIKVTEDLDVLKVRSESAITKVTEERDAFKLSSDNAIRKIMDLAAKQKRFEDEAIKTNTNLGEDKLRFEKELHDALVRETRQENAHIGEKQTLHEEVSRLQIQLRETNITNMLIETELATAKTQLESEESRHVKELESARQTANTARIKLENDCNKCIHKLEARITKLQAGNDEGGRTVTALRDEILELTSTVTQAGEEKSTNEQIIKEHLDTISALREDTVNAKHDNDVLQSLNATLQENIHTRERDLEEAANDKAKLEHNIKVVTADLSERVFTVENVLLQFSIDMDDRGRIAHRIIADLTQQNIHLKEAIEQVSGEKAELGKSLKNQLYDLQVNFKRVNAENNNSRQRMNFGQNNSIQTALENGNLKQGITSLKQSNTSLRRLIISTNKNIAATNKENAELKTKMTSFHQIEPENSKLKQDVSTLEREKRELKRDVSTLEHEKTKLKQDVSTLEREKRELKQGVSTLEREKFIQENDFENKMIELNDRISSSNDLITSLTERISTLDAEVLRMPEEIDKRVKELFPDAISKVIVPRIQQIATIFSDGQPVESVKSMKDLGQYVVDKYNAMVKLSNGQRAFFVDKIRALRDECTSKDAINEDLRARLTTANNANFQLQTSEKNLATRNEGLSKELTAANNRKSQLETANKGQATSIEHLSKELTTANTANSQLKNSKNNLAALNRKISDDLTAANNANSQLKDSKNNLAALNRKISDELVAVKDRKSQLETANKGQATSIESLFDELTAANAANSELKSSKKDLATSNQKLSEDLTVAYNANSRLETATTQQITRIESLERDLREANTQQTNCAEVLQGKLNVLGDTNSNLMVENQKLRENVAENTTLIVTLQQEVTLLEGRCAPPAASTFSDSHPVNPPSSPATRTLSNAESQAPPEDSAAGVQSSSYNMFFLETGKTLTLTNLDLGTVLSKDLVQNELVHQVTRALNSIFLVKEDLLSKPPRAHNKSCLSLRSKNKCSKWVKGQNFACGRCQRQGSFCMIVVESEKRYVPVVLPLHPSQRNTNAVKTGVDFYKNGSNERELPSP